MAQKQSVVHHIGRNMDEGHYVTDVRLSQEDVLTPQKANEWTRFNDSLEHHVRIIYRIIGGFLILRNC